MESPSVEAMSCLQENQKIKQTGRIHLKGWPDMMMMMMMNNNNINYNNIGISKWQEKEFTGFVGYMQCLKWAGTHWNAVLASVLNNTRSTITCFSPLEALVTLNANNEDNRINNSHGWIRTSTGKNDQEHFAMKFPTQTWTRKTLVLYILKECWFSVHLFHVIMTPITKITLNHDTALQS